MPPRPRTARGYRCPASSMLGTMDLSRYPKASAGNVVRELLRRHRNLRSDEMRTERHGERRHETDPGTGRQNSHRGQCRKRRNQTAKTAAARLAAARVGWIWLGSIITVMEELLLNAPFANTPGVSPAAWSDRSGRLPRARSRCRDRCDPPEERRSGPDQPKPANRRN